MTWPAVYLALLLSHLGGDFLLQTEWQALNKRRGIGRDATSRRALVFHGATYTLAYVPALVWLGGEHGPLAAVGLAALITLPHLTIDDGRVLFGWLGRVKHCEEPSDWLVAAVDQSFHLVMLLPVALLGAG
jgi:hypothetical protein